MRANYLAVPFLALFAVTSAYSQAQDKGEHIVRGNIVCLEMDQAGKAKVSQDFTQCEGVVYMLSVDGRIASIHGSEEEMRKLSASSKTRMGYRLPLRLKGSDAGHQRAWRLHMESLETIDIDSADGEKITVTGTIYCIFPEYDDGKVNPMVATEPCDGYMNHAHLIYTDDGKTLAVHGPHEKITALEKTSERENTTLSGSLQGNSGGWILHVN